MDKILVITKPACAEALARGEDGCLQNPENQAKVKEYEHQIYPVRNLFYLLHNLQCAANE